LNKIDLTEEINNSLYRRLRRGAYVRVGASAILWFFALAAYKIQLIDSYSYAGISLSVIYLILINPPTLWVVRHLEGEKLRGYWSLAINALEVLGYTAIIYFVGGLSRSYVTLLYTALISYVGVMASRQFTFFVTAFCSLALTAMVFFEDYQVVPHTQNSLIAQIPLTRQLFEVAVITGFLLLTAFIVSSTSLAIKKGKRQLTDQNEALRKSQQKLEEAQTVLEERNVALKEAMEKAQASDRLKSDFLANMSHELRTPLNHIIGFSELLSDSHFGALNSTQEEYLNDILQSSRHLLSLINDLLDLSKIEAGKMAPSYSEIPLKSLLESSLVTVKEKALEHRVQITTHFEDIPLTLWADGRMIKQILYNLLSNAVKFNPDGGVVRLTAQRVKRSEFSAWSEKEMNSHLHTLNCKHNADYLAISITDNGIGLSTTVLDRLFKPFEQGDNSSSRMYPGIGLGLALTRKMVELHQGRIGAFNNKEGQGSTFQVTLPLHLPNQETKP
jgi:signal transduction histidine kinase